MRIEKLSLPLPCSHGKKKPPESVYNLCDHQTITILPVTTALKVSRSARALKVNTLNSENPQPLSTVLLQNPHQSLSLCLKRQCLISCPCLISAFKFSFLPLTRGLCNQMRSSEIQVAWVLSVEANIYYKSLWKSWL